MPLWCCDKVKAVSNFCAKVQNCVYIVANQAIFRVFFLYKTKNKKREQVKNVNDDINHVFMMHNKIHYKSVGKWIMDLEASKHMTL